MDTSTEDQYHKMDLRESCSSRIGIAKKLMQKYDRQTSSLPKVEADGTSKCPDAESWYADHEEAKEELHRKITECEQCLAAIKVEKARMRHNCQCIANAEQLLHNAGPKAELAYEDKFLLSLYHDLERQQEEMERLLAQLRESYEQPCRKWPLGKPKKHLVFGNLPDGPIMASPPFFNQPSVSAPSAPRVLGELGALASLNTTPGNSFHGN